MDLSENKTESYKTGVFTENGLLGLREVFEHKATDHVQPFIRAFADIIGGNEEKRNVTELLTK